MTESVKKYFRNATSNDTVAILFITINNRLSLFTKVNARTVNRSTISKSVINRKDRFVMRKNRNIELYGPDIFHDYNAKDFFIKDIHQMHKEL